MENEKYRHELKYPVTSAQIAVLRSRISGLLSRDAHAGESGVYTISSLYFDDIYNRCFYENENGTDPREKFRIRIYNHSPERITLELKRKECGKTLKKSVLLSREQAEMLISGQTLPVTENQPPLLRKLTEDMKRYRLRPVVIAEYERYPFVYKNGNVRITFDTNISSSNAISQFLQETYPKRPVMPTGLQLLEVKYDEYLPDPVYRALQLENLQQTAFSKYYLCRKYAMK